ncbi:SDR family NAD(P)-dependent oxidoreductase, partial [bacterium]|nr:SDR family NAD(P)-dependent oxidoreductase [bacterium]
MSGPRLENKHVAITGAGSGIGQAIAVRFAAEGAVVEILERDEDAAEATCGLISGAGGSGYVVIVDVADEASVKGAFDKLASERGPVDVLVNNAGIA